MVAPLVGAALRAAATQAAKQAAKQVAKQAAKQVATQAARKTVSEKTLGQAVRRYAGASKRFSKEAEALKGVKGKGRYKDLLSKASKRLDKLARELETSDRTSSRVLDLVRDSDKYLVKSTKTKAARGDLLGETLLDGTMQGHRLFSVTRDIWEGVSYEDRFAALKDAFGGKNISEIILEIEEKTHINIMKGDINSRERYGELSEDERIKITDFIRANYA